MIGGDIAVSDAVIDLGTPTGTHKTVAKRRKRNSCGCLDTLGWGAAVALCNSGRFRLFPRNLSDVSVLARLAFNTGGELVGSSTG